MKRRTLLAGAGGVLGCSLAGCTGQSSAGADACDEVTLEPDIRIENDREGDVQVALSIVEESDDSEEMVYEESIEVSSGFTTSRSRVFSQFLERGSESQATYTLSADVEDVGSATQPVPTGSPARSIVDIEITDDGVRATRLHIDPAGEHVGLHEDCYWEG